MGIEESYYKSLQIAQKVTKYFDGFIGGSALLQNKIDRNLINDIDVFISKERFWNAKIYLHDNGFVETKNSSRQEGYQDTIGSCLFELKGYLPIHLNIANIDPTLVYDYRDVLSQKIYRYNESDKKQIQSFLNNN